MYIIQARHLSLEKGLYFEKISVLTSNLDSLLRRLGCVAENPLEYSNMLPRLGTMRLLPGEEHQWPRQKSIQKRRGHRERMACFMDGRH